MLQHDIRILLILGMLAAMCGPASAAVGITAETQTIEVGVPPVCTAPCECISENEAAQRWGVEGYERCSKTICGETADGNIQYYCIHQKGTAVAAPLVTTTTGAAVPQEVKVPVSSAAVPATPPAAPSTTAAGITPKTPLGIATVAVRNIAKYSPPLFARRDSGQFPLMNELVAQHPFYYTTDLDMPQWEPANCPLCRMNRPLLSWKDMPEL